MPPFDSQAPEPYDALASMEIVRLPPDRWQDYQRLRLEALQQAPQAFESTYAEYRARPATYWQERLQSVAEGKGNWLLFAREGDRLVGMAGAYLHEGTAEVISVYVTPAARRRGVARALLTALLGEISRGKASRQARLTVSDSQAAALALYRSLGFRVVGRQHLRPGDGREQGELVMERALP